jgi:NAD(P)H-dependent flavin oxidoreductase YrpB (nitropropane dioxygenase family)
VLKTELCRQLGIDHPILSVGFGPGAGPKLAAAVSEAGACGCLGSGGSDPTRIRQLVGEVRSLTSKPFGVNAVLAINREGVIEACLDEGVPLLVLFWGDPAPWIADAHRSGVQVLVQAGSVAEARAAADAGADAIIAQGCEAGGHVRGRTSLMTLIPTVVEAVGPLPVIAAGGIATGRGVAAALSLGAQGVHMGTRFVASEEADYVPAYKQRVVEASAEDVVFCDNLFDKGWEHAPHRVLRNRVVNEWEAAGRPPSGARPKEGSTIGTVLRGSERSEIDVFRYSPVALTSDFRGDIEDGPLFAGESCSLVHDVLPAAQIVRDVVREAEETLAGLRQA